MTPAGAADGAIQPFTFAIPLIARALAPDWPLVEALLGLTLASLSRQTDRRFRVLLAGHDRPDLARDPSPADPVAVEFLRADWPAERVHVDNRDSGRKKHLLDAAVRARGGGLLMFLDADDWVDTRLVAAARAAITPAHVGGLIAAGFAIDLRNRRALPVPHPRGFAQGFDRLCGSSTVLRVDPQAPDPIRRDPYRILHEHDRFEETCAGRGLAVARLDVAGAYVVNTAANHSTAQGPFAAWRRVFDDQVAREGAPADRVFLARFGIDPEQLDRLGQAAAPRGTGRRHGSGTPISR